VCVRGCEWDDDSMFLFLFSSEFFFRPWPLDLSIFKVPPFGEDRISYGVLADLLL
jgi:hypothetical protein